MSVTEAVRDAVCSSGHECRIVTAEPRGELETRLRKVADEKLRIMDVSGIPGLKPVKRRS